MQSWVTHEEMTRTMTIGISGGKLVSDTCLTIPHALKLRCKAAGINMTRVLVTGLEKELQRKEEAEHETTKER
jgi:post-segregation antitoxin (ccd killing protein)